MKQLTAAELAEFEAWYAGRFGSPRYSNPTMDHAAKVDALEIWAAALHVTAATKVSQAEPAPAAALAIPEDCPHIIWFDDQDQRPLVFAGHGARAAAEKTFKKVSTQWNAHLFVRIEKNSRDCPYPVAAVVEAPPAVKQIPAK